MLPLEPDLLRTQPAGLAGRFLSVADYHEAYKTGVVTPLDVVSELVRLTDPLRQPAGKYAGAWAQTHGAEALKAAEASTVRWKRGEPLGVLDGVPFGVKDDLAVEGFVSRMGMRVKEGEEYFWRECEETVWPVRALQAAGAVMVGKLNQHEIGMGEFICASCVRAAVVLLLTGW
jgi:Asp-tRNA(Asn)/Glu-tRNA(Gln) amidotransferase A subunit family amidase